MNMIMKAICKILAAAAVMAAAAGCYEDFELPAPATRYDSDEAFLEAFADEGLECVTIAEVKAQFNKAFGSIENTGRNNDSWAQTKTVKFGELSALEKNTAADHISPWPEAANYYIKGKVISDDTQGNVYKSLFVYDGTAAIEIKLTNGVALSYPQGSWVYIKLRNLYLGNYRMMLSIGEGPTSSYNIHGRMKHYANSNIENEKEIAAHVFAGRLDRIKPEDIKVVDESNYTELGEADFGRLVCFKGVKCYYSVAKTQNGKAHPNPIIDNTNYNAAQKYPQWIDTNYEETPVTKVWYKWAYAVDGVNLYGSVCFTYHYDALANGTAGTVYCTTPGVYVVRSSGYSRFAGRPVPRDGAQADITAIYGVYGTNYGSETYQLTVNNFEDMVFYDGEAAFLTDGTKDTNGDGKVDEHDSNEVLAMTPNGFSYNEEEGSFVYNSDDDSYYVPSEESSDRTMAD